MSIVPSLIDQSLKGLKFVKHLKIILSSLEKVLYVKFHDSPMDGVRRKVTSKDRKALGFEYNHVSYSKNRTRRGGNEEKIYVKYLHFDHL